MNMMLLSHMWMSKPVVYGIGSHSDEHVNLNKTYFSLKTKITVN